MKFPYIAISSIPERGVKSVSQSKKRNTESHFSVSHSLCCSNENMLACFQRNAHRFQDLLYAISSYTD